VQFARQIARPVTPQEQAETDADLAQRRSGPALFGMFLALAIPLSVYLFPLCTATRLESAAIAQH
jgi:hypothetical protein